MRMPDIYRPLLDRTVENYQVQHLVRKFDFGKESRIARLIVQAINAAVEQEEANLRITRVRPLNSSSRPTGKVYACPCFRMITLHPFIKANLLPLPRNWSEKTV